MFENFLIIGNVVPLLKKAVENAATKFIESRVLKGLESLTPKQKPELAQAVGDAYGEWLTAVIFHLQGEGWDEAQIREFFPHYVDALEIFLKDEEVAEELLKPFRAVGSKVTLDADKLQARWNALELRPLPEDFEAFDVGKSYLKRLEKARIIKPEFRDLFTAQQSVAQTGFLEAIRGAWPDFDLDNYARRVKTRYHVLDLAALTPPERDDQERLRLRDVFIAAHVKESRPPRELPKELWIRAQGEDAQAEEWSADEFKRLHSEWTQKTPEPVLTALARHRLAVILGDPGSGKSTLARYVLLSLLEPPQPEPEWLTGFRGHLPLLVELRDYMGSCAAGSCQGFLEYFHHLGKTQGYALNHLQLKEHLKERPSLLIFDGLDEIFEAQPREQMIQQIIGVAGEYPLARIIVTSRIVGYSGQALQAAEFREYTLQDLNPTQIEAFARGWFGLIYAKQAAEAHFREERIRRAVQGSPAIRQLAGNPLLLTMIAIIAKHQELPRERVKLYDHAAKVLCHHWDVTGHKIPLKALPADFMLENHKLELLRRLARRMQDAPKGLAGNFIAGEDLRGEIESYLQQRWKLPPTESAPLSAAILGQLRERNFILCLSGPSLYSFVHRTFLEYFSAAEIVERFEKEQTLSFEQLRDEVFLRYYRVPAWHEVLRLISGMIAPRFADELIVAITPPRQEVGKKADDLILAVQCLAELADVQNAPLAAERVLEGMCGWFETGSYSENFLENAVPAVESIGKQWPGREKYVAWLSIAIFEKRHSIKFFELNVFSKVVNALWADIPLAKDNLITMLNRNWASSYFAFDALARCYRTDTQALLHDQIVCGKAINAAFWTLIQHYKEEPDTLPLIHKALEYAHEDVRRAAVDALAQHYQDAADTLPLLRKTAESHADSATRSQAAMCLIQYYQENEFALPLFNPLLHDANENARRDAVAGIALASGNQVWQRLLTANFTGAWFWLDSQAEIDEARVQEAAEELKITPEAVRGHYEEIAQEIPLRLAWQAR